MEKKDVSTCIREIQGINSAYKWEEKHLMCATCKQWLIQEIYTNEQKCNFCKTCKPKTGVAVRCFALEDIFLTAGLRYPCQIARCNFVGNSKELQNHLHTDTHGRIICTICGALTSDYRIIEHFNKMHPVFIMNLFTNKLFIEIPYVKLSRPECLLNITITRGATKHTFLVLIKVNETNVWFKVASPSLHLLRRAEYVVENKSANRTVSHRGTIHSVCAIFERPEIEHVQMEREPGMIVTMYFGGQYDITDMQSCAVCNATLNWEVYLCVDGHCVCPACAPRFLTCPVCRTQMTGQKTVLEHLLPYNTFPCQNSLQGCIYIGTFLEIHRHLSSCLYKN